MAGCDQVLSSVVGRDQVRLSVACLDYVLASVAGCDQVLITVASRRLDLEGKCSTFCTSVKNQPYLVIMLTRCGSCRFVGLQVCRFLFEIFNFFRMSFSKKRTFICRGGWGEDKRGDSNSS